RPPAPSPSEGRGAPCSNGMETWIGSMRVIFMGVGFNYQAQRCHATMDAVSSEADDGPDNIHKRGRPIASAGRICRPRAGFSSYSPGRLSALRYGKYSDTGRSAWD